MTASQLKSRNSAEFLFPILQNSLILFILVEFNKPDFESIGGGIFNTVSSCQDPERIDERAPTELSPIECPQHSLPRPLSWLCHRAPYNSCPWFLATMSWGLRYDDAFAPFSIVVIVTCCRTPETVERGCDALIVLLSFVGEWKYTAFVVFSLDFAHN